MTPVPFYCVLCARHYGDSGICDEGKPMRSPHRRERPRDELRLAATTFRKGQAPAHPPGFRPIGGGRG